MRSLGGLHGGGGPVQLGAGGSRGRRQQKSADTGIRKTRYVPCPTTDLLVMLQVVTQAVSAVDNPQTAQLPLPVYVQTLCLFGPLIVESTSFTSVHFPPMSQPM